MEKIDNTINNYNHGVTLVERKSLIVTGVKKIENFDDEEFLMETSMGFLVVKGEELALIKLDTLQGNVSRPGTLKGLNYIEAIKNKDKNKEQGIFNRLFK